MTAMPNHLKCRSAESAPGNNFPLLDKARINQLRAVLGPIRVESLFELLVKELASRPTLIRSAVLNGDAHRARHESHSFKGAATSVGAVALGRAAATIEHALDLQAMGSALPTLDQEAKRTLDAIAALLPSTSPAREAR